MTTVLSIRVFDPKQGTRDGLEFKAEINKKERRCFISGTALAILGRGIQGEREDIFDVRAMNIALIVSRKAESAQEGAEISINSLDVPDAG
ncbi:hypothetical protein [Burkholderia guangdongensis]|uniref:hypothetical protein n=1 Tax=Burkholderia guangdongensis TaxID=1792500 RepID=UPI0015C960E1|nr:hypothetical protein [Burkholderia guangdongensis]